MEGFPRPPVFGPALSVFFPFPFGSCVLSSADSEWGSCRCCCDDDDTADVDDVDDDDVALP